MNSPKFFSSLRQEANEVADSQNCFDFAYEPVADVDPLELLGNAYLALHHHMAPADGGFDLDQGGDE
jgi:hypothetical protein